MSQRKKVIEIIVKLIYSSVLSYIEPLCDVVDARLAELLTEYRDSILQ